MHLEPSQLECQPLPGIPTLLLECPVPQLGCSRDSHLPRWGWDHLSRDLRHSHQPGAPHGSPSAHGQEHSEMENPEEGENIPQIPAPPAAGWDPLRGIPGLFLWLSIHSIPEQFLRIFPGNGLISCSPQMIPTLPPKPSKIWDTPGMSRGAKPRGLIVPMGLFPHFKSG